jgi:arsenate reductase-like glutaredoxin family protein
MQIESEKPPEENVVTLYVVPNCPLCAGARLWLSQHGVEYLERNVANDFGALRSMYKLTRQQFVPVFEANGRALVRPTDEELAEFLLNQ